jgi:Fic family protein
MKDIWKPKFTITPDINSMLMKAEAIRTEVDSTAIPVSVEADIRHNIRIRSTHYSTYIEGNRLSLKETEQVITKKKVSFFGRERDVKEVQDYWNALIKVEEWAESRTEITETMIKKIHAMSHRGRAYRPTPYRDGQNVIRESKTGKIVYMPPEAKDVPALMKGLLAWMLKSEKSELAVPIIAGLAHYQFVTIHPYFDGNGRTARLLATYLLQKNGYGLHGLFSMEEHHAKELGKYYGALATHQHHNYYEGRAGADLTGWVEYFVSMLLKAYEGVGQEIQGIKGNSGGVDAGLFGQLDRRAKIVLPAFRENSEITTGDIANLLRVSRRMAGNYAAVWVEKGILEISNVSDKARSYKLGRKYEKIFGIK